jgi:hypothetical protein
MFPFEEYRVSLSFLQPFFADIAEKTLLINPCKHLQCSHLSFKKKLVPEFNWFRIAYLVFVRVQKLDLELPWQTLHLSSKLAEGLCQCCRVVGKNLERLGLPPAPARNVH